MSRPIDWSALDLGSDPIPGEPDAVHSGGQDYVTVADAIARAVTALRSMELDGDVSLATDELITNAAEVADSIERAEDRYRETGLALLDYAPRLASAQETSLSALRLAESAREDAREAERKRIYNLRLAGEADDEVQSLDYRELVDRYAVRVVDSRDRSGAGWPGEVVHLVPLRNAQRFSVAELRESEALWRGGVDNLAPNSSLYRLYGGPNSRQVGGSFTNVDPYTLDFPHNSLGLPADNTMQRMATFDINPGATPVNQRHALPYEGTLGGAPEYVFPRGNGVNVVDDVPFTVP